MRRTHVDLFSGIGGFSLACEWAGVETVAFAETDSYASRVLQRHWPNVRNYGRVQDVPSHSAWLLTAGVPCQPASVAGKRKGAADDRWLWPQTLAVVKNGSYEWLLFENPTGILSLNDGLEFERICAALEGQGYEVQPIVIPACAVGALHRRDRIWILAHSASNGSEAGISGSESREEGIATVAINDGAVMADATNFVRPRSGTARSGRNGSADNGENVSVSVNDGLYRAAINEAESGGNGTHNRLPIGSDTWSVEPNVGRVANGIPKRVDRLRCLGNAIVPQVAYQLIKRMIEAEQ